MIQYFFIALVQSFKFHARNDIGCTVGVARDQAGQAALLFEALVEPCARGGIEQAHHGRHDSAFLNKVDLPLENGGRVAVEAHDETALNLEAGSLHAFNACDQIPIFILLFIAFRQSRFIRGLNPDKDRPARQ